MSYLLDADWVIEALKGREHAVAPLLQLSQQRVAISWITVGEIYEGAYGFPDPQAHLTSFRQFLQPFPKLNVDDGTMEQLAQIRSLLRRSGQIIPDFDIMVAATALHHDLTVLTFNIRHFNRIPGLKLYQTGDDSDG